LHEKKVFSIHYFEVVHLIKNEELVGRSRDKEDLEILKEVRGIKSH
jgi:hypothetical protein